MAARFAVASGNWSGAIWAATAGGAAGSAAVPTNADDATVNKNVTVTINDTTAVALTLTLSNGTTGADVGAQLTCTTSADWNLTIENGLTTTATSNPSNTATYTSFVNFDMSGSAYTGIVVLNNAGSATSTFGVFNCNGDYVLKGKSRKRHTTITAAMSAGAVTANVADATGWAAGDVVVFAATEGASTTPKTDRGVVDTITAIGGGAYSGTGAATINWTGGTTYIHADGAPCANFTSNLTFRPKNANDYSTVSITSILNQQSRNCYVDNVAFGARVGGVDLGMRSSQSPGGVLYFSASSAANNAGWKHMGITNNALYQFRAGGLGCNYLSGAIPRQWNVFWSTNASASMAVGLLQSANWPCGPDEDYCILAAQSGINGANGGTIPISYSNAYQYRHKISGLFDNSGNGAAISTNTNVYDCQIFSCHYGIATGYGARVERTYFSENLFANGGVTTEIYPFPPSQAEFVDCKFGTAITVGNISTNDFRKVTLINKENDATQQEIYQYQSTTVPAIKRDSTVTSNATSSLLFTLNSATAQSYQTQFMAKAATAIKILIPVRKSSSPAYGASTLPSVTLSGLGITPVTVTMSGGTAADAWETLSLDLAAGSAPSTDGLLTLTFTARSSTAGAKAYFSGVPVAPFSSRCRHYGYLFDETLLTRTANGTIDPAISYTTASAYTGITVTWNTGATPSTTALATNDVTFKQLYHYTQAVGTSTAAIIGSNMPITGSGGYDAPVLFAQGNISTVSAYKLSGSGSLSMGSYTLSTYFAGAIAYTYTGGTWSQASTVPTVPTVPTFSGGTLTPGAVLTSATTFSMSAGTVVMGITSAAWDLSGATFTGTLNLRTDTHSRAVTVLVPAGTTVDTTGESAITVTYTTVTRGLDFNGVVAGATVKVFDTGTQTVRATPTGPNWIWSESGGTDVTVDYTIQLVGYDPIRITGVTVNSAVLPVTVQQQVARSYQTSSGLTFGTNCYANPTTKLFGLTAASTLQNFYCRMIESWITEATLQNKPFPIVPNGPNSFTLTDGWDWDLTTYPNSIALLSRDGMRRTDAGGTVTDLWAAVLSVGVPTGFQVRYQQQDGLGTTNAQNTGNIDQLIKIKKTGAGAFDYTGWLVLKCQKEGYDQAEAIAADIYGTLEDQLYVFGLTPLPNGIAAGAVDATVTVTAEPTPVEWPAASGKFFSTTITDTTNAHSGLQIMQAVRAENEFNWSDLIRPNGAKFKTVTGNFYGDTYATPAGVRVVKADGVTPHPDFDLFGDDSGSNPYVPPVVAPIGWDGALDGTTVLLYNDVGGGAGVIVDTQTISGAGGYSLDVTLPSVDVAVGDPLRIRFGHKQYYAGELQGTMTATGLTFVGSMTLHPVYAAWGIDGAVYDQGYTPPGPYTMDGTHLQIDIAAAATTGTKVAMCAWTQYLLTLPAGLAAFFGAWDLLAVNQIRQNVSVVDVLIDVPTAGALFTFTDNDVNYYRSDFSYPGNVEAGHGLIAITYNASIFVPDPVIISGESVVTGTPATVSAAVRTELSAELAASTEVWQRLGLDLAAPLTQTESEISVGGITLAVTEPSAGSVVVTRQP